MGAVTVTCPVYGGIAPPAPARKAGYDAARTTPENRKHWQEADGLAPAAQLTPQVRRVLRNRARYEVQNNSYAAGLVRTLVADTVGAGARLQMLTDDAALNREVEALWSVWAAAADWPLTSRVLAGVEVVAGECFGALYESKRLGSLNLPVPLNIKLIEPDQVAHPYGYVPADGAMGDDGIECDADGDPVAYHVLKSHPGDSRNLLGQFESKRVPAEDMVHWFQPTRPGQLRGVTMLAPSLPLFAQLRRFTSATLTAAEFAAMLAGVMTQQDAPGADPTSVEAMDTFELVRGTLLTLPPGAAATQFKPEQPTTNYEMFVNAKLRECGRPINVPFGKMAGDHSKYNYSSGRMDDAPYWHDRDIQRGAMEAKVFDPFLYRWLEWAMLAAPALRRFRGRWWACSHRWQYDARPVTDPLKDAGADEANLTNGSDSLADIAAREGTTEDELIRKRAETKKKFEAAGLPLPPWLTGVQAGAARPAAATERGATTDA